MANIQGETLICVSNSDREGAQTQLHLQDRDVSLMSALPRYVPASLGPGVGFGCDADPGLLLGGTPPRLCYAGGGREWGAFCTCLLLSALSLMVVCFFKDELCMDLPFVSTESYPGASRCKVKLRRPTLIPAPFKGNT